ncbi:hypothetical protein EII18_00485 [Comamonadaceae bacterium OH3737_COT-264]|nr:hypothetical protein EII18_00485 [Comamonadaceae bacterium OH3737_COT-264]
MPVKAPMQTHGSGWHASPKKPIKGKKTTPFRQQHQSIDFSIEMKKIRPPHQSCQSKKMKSPCFGMLSIKAHI